MYVGVRPDQICKNDLRTDTTYHTICDLRSRWEGGCFSTTGIMNPRSLPKLLIISWSSHVLLYRGYAHSPRTDTKTGQRPHDTKGAGTNDGVPVPCLVRRVDVRAGSGRAGMHFVPDLASYNLYSSTCLFSRNSIFLSQ